MPRELEGAPAGLRATQRWLASLILAPELLERDDVGRSIDATIAIDDRETAAARLRAYTNGYPARLFEALADDFPALAHVLGPPEFMERNHCPSGLGLP